MLASGSLGFVYLMEERRRLTLEELDERHPALIPALIQRSARTRTSGGCSSGRPSTARSSSLPAAHTTWPRGESTAGTRSPCSRRTRRTTTSDPQRRWPPGHTIGWAETFVHGLDHLLTAIADDGEVGPHGATFADGYRAAEVCEAMLRSSEHGERAMLAYRELPANEQPR